MEATLDDGEQLWRFVNIYRAPYSKKHRFTILHFLDEFDQYLSLVRSKNGNPIIVGDFNIHVEKEDDINSIRFQNLLTEFQLVQHVPHVATHNEGGTLDLVLTDSHHDVTGLEIIKLGTSSDHYFVSMNSLIVLQPLQRQYKLLNYRNFVDIDIPSFKADILESGLANPEMFGLLDHAVSYLNKTLSALIDKHCPIIKRKVNVKNKVSGWFDEELRILRRRRRAAERLKRKHNTAEFRQAYINICNSFSQLVWVKRRRFYQSSLEASKNDKKALFKKINRLMGTEELGLPRCTDDLDLAEQFKSYFTSKIDTIRSNIESEKQSIDHDTPTFELTENIGCCFNAFKAVTETELLEIVKSMPSKFCSLDPIPTWLFKECLPELLPLLHYIVNQSLETGTFPCNLQHAVVKPTLKKNDMDRDILSSYRPVSNLAFVSKVLEKCSLRQLSSYLEENNLICEAQSGYRPNHSCETLLIRMFNDINGELCHNNVVALLLLDLSAAFDAIDHDVLLAKLQYDYGLGSSVLLWLSSYLRGRSFSVNVKGKLSSQMLLLYGVPQGSLLGPVLFILYTKDLQKIARKYGLYIQLYADDSQLYLAFNVLDPTDVSNKMNQVESCFQEIKCWMIKHFMKLNEDKTEFIILGKKSMLQKCENITLRIGDSEILPSTFTKDSAKSLGVKLDSELSMKRQVSEVRRKAYWTLNNLSNFAKFLTQELKISLVKTLILSKVDYCNALYAGINKTEIHRLNGTLNSAVRFIFNIRDYGDDIREYYKKAHILPVELRVKYKLCLLVHKALEGISPPYLCELINLYHEQPNKQGLRSYTDKRLLLRSSVPETKISRKMFSFQAPMVWNALPLELRHELNTDSFKRSLKTFYFNQIDLVNL